MSVSNTHSLKFYNNFKFLLNVTDVVMTQFFDYVKNTLFTYNITMLYKVAN